MLAAAPGADETTPEADRLTPEAEDRAEVMVLALMLAEAAEAEIAEAEMLGFPSWADSVAAGAAPEPFPEAETAPRSATLPVAASPPPVAVRVGAW
jgi:hypothetical protein